MLRRCRWDHKSEFSEWQGAEVFVSFIFIAIVAGVFENRAMSTSEIKSISHIKVLFGRGFLAFFLCGNKKNGADSKQGLVLLAIYFLVRKVTARWQWQCLKAASRPLEAQWRITQVGRERCTEKVGREDTPKHFVCLLVKHSRSLAILEANLRFRNIGIYPEGRGETLTMVSLQFAGTTLEVISLLTTLSRQDSRCFFGRPWFGRLRFGGIEKF